MKVKHNPTYLILKIVGAASIAISAAIDVYMIVKGFSVALLIPSLILLAGGIIVIVVSNNLSRRLSVCKYCHYSYKKVPAQVSYNVLSAYNDFNKDSSGSSRMSAKEIKVEFTVKCGHCGMEDKFIHVFYVDNNTDPTPIINNYIGLNFKNL